LKKKSFASLVDLAAPEKRLPMSSGDLNQCAALYKFYVSSLDSLDPNWKEDKRLVEKAKQLLLRACSPECPQPQPIDSLSVLASAWDSQRSTVEDSNRSTVEDSRSVSNEDNDLPVYSSEARSVCNDSDLPVYSHEASAAASPVRALSPISPIRNPTPPPPRSPITLESRPVPPRTSIQSIAAELGYPELSGEDVHDVGELAMELYQLLRVKISPKRFKCLCQGCSIPACHESEREVLRRAVKEICSERNKM
jgi:hypothetical protein